MPSLLLVACSARKRIDPPEPIRALDRYDGVFFRVLRKWTREKAAPSPDVLIISAKFGLIDGNTSIPEYDQHMTQQRANQMASQVQQLLRAYLTERQPEKIFVNLGRHYLPTVAEMTELQGATWAEGSIGFRAQQMKKWLAALADNSEQAQNPSPPPCSTVQPQSALERWDGQTIRTRPR